jgi:transcriptional regulator with XRE-family HTH domain
VFTHVNELNGEIELADYHELSPAMASALRTARYRRGITLTEAARITGCTKGHLSLLENAKRAPSATMARALIRTYRLSPDDAERLTAESVKGVGRDKHAKAAA